jgi:hypothetical protein
MPSRPSPPWAAATPSPDHRGQDHRNGGDVRGHGFVAPLTAFMAERFIRQETGGDQRARAARPRRALREISARGSIGWSEADEADPGEGSTAPSILSPLLELLLLHVTA